MSPTTIDPHYMYISLSGQDRVKTQSSDCEEGINTK